MARVKTAKQRITDYLRAKGYDTADIREAFDELDAADTDLDKLTQDLGLVTQKNAEWQDWYNRASGEFQGVISERDSLKQQISKLEAAGVKFGNATATPTTTSDVPTPQGYITAAQFEDFKQNLMKGTSGVLKGLTKVTMKHMKEFNEEPDIDEIEKLVSTKGYSVEDAYDVWSRPKYEEKKTKWIDSEVERRTKEAVQSELSKKGISRTRKRADDVELAPLDKPAPSESELREAFINDLNSDTVQ